MTTLTTNFQCQALRILIGLKIDMTASVSRERIAGLRNVIEDLKGVKRSLEQPLSPANKVSALVDPTDKGLTANVQARKGIDPSENKVNPHSYLTEILKGRRRTIQNTMQKVEAERAHTISDRSKSPLTTAAGGALIGGIAGALVDNPTLGALGGATLASYLESTSGKQILDKALGNENASLMKRTGAQAAKVFHAAAKKTGGEPRMTLGAAALGATAGATAGRGLALATGAALIPGAMTMAGLAGAATGGTVGAALSGTDTKLSDELAQTATTASAAVAGAAGRALISAVKPTAKGAALLGYNAGKDGFRRAVSLGDRIASRAITDNTLYSSSMITRHSRALEVEDENKPTLKCSAKRKRRTCCLRVATGGS